MTFMRFVKAETNGNDFIIVEDVTPDLVDIKKICNRKYGIGCDQIIFIQKQNVSFFNSDGSRANMCGNGLAALAKYTCKDEFIVNNKKYKCIIYQNGDIAVEVKILSVEKNNNYFLVDVGNKHIVFFENNDDYLNYTDEYNVHYAKIAGNTINIITYERGAGRTNACGSGAVAVAAASGMHDVTIIHEGGISNVKLSKNIATLVVRPNIVFSGITMY